MRRAILCASTAAAILATGLMAAPATAQTKPKPTAAQAEANSIDEVIVTGSFIRGAAQQAALPVLVVSQEELQKQGAPSTVELIKSIPATGGVIGDTNGFAAGRTEGAANVNLRGLGPARTLVLLNGRRIVNSSLGAFVDVNTIPPAAIGRVEVLKDGAAATYGSDAIGGVVNFITRKNFKGLEIGGDYSGIQNSDGDYTFRAAGGYARDNWDGFFALGYQHRSQLSASDRDFATPNFTDQAGAKAAYLYNPQGGWSSAANPGTYIGGTGFNANFLDPGCPAVGGELQISATQCLFRYTDFYHLVEDTNLYQVYGELNYRFNDKTRLHLEATVADTEVFHIAQSTSYGPNQYPTGLTSAVQSQYLIPASNPGLVTLFALNPALAAANPIGRTVGVLAHPFFERPIGVGGNALYGNGAQENKRFAGQYRISADLTGEWDKFGGIGWDVAATYSQSDADSTNADFLVDRLELAYRGLGSKANGPACDRLTGTPGTGNCYYFNPFSTAIQTNAITGAVNPQYAAAVALDPRVVNDPEVIRWMYGDDPQRTKTKNELFVIDAVANGKLPFKLWADEPVRYAVGYQRRQATFKFYGVGFVDNATYPCIDSILTGTKTCAISNGPYTFYGNYAPASVSQDTDAFFGELNVPVTKDLQLQLAVRHEDSSGGSTTNPKFAFRWQVSPLLAFRGSVGTTFRAAPQASLIPNAVTGLSFVSQTSSYKPFDNYGNPNLAAETADTYNVGAIFNLGNFSATVDYFRFEFGNPIGTESGIQILNAIFPSGQPNKCADPTYAALISRVTFNGACAPGNIVRTRTNTINGAAIMTDGLDFSADYRWRDAPFGGRINLGLDATFIFDYQVGATVVEGITTVSARNVAGKLNYQTTGGSLPRLRGSAFAEYSKGRHNIRLTVRYIGEQYDQRDATFLSTNNGQGVVDKGRVVDSFITTDLVYRLQLPYDTTFSASIINLTDEDPPFARLDYSYDPYTANPIGRVIKVGVNKRF
ncbi:TonB-dependent receptor [soil metagenome]